MEKRLKYIIWVVVVLAVIAAIALIVLGVKGKLGGSKATPAIVLTPPSTSAPASITVPNTNCSQKGVDFLGHDMAGQKGGVTDYNGCRSYCASLSGCKYWTWNANGNNCYPKTSNAGATNDCATCISGTPSDNACAT